MNLNAISQNLVALAAVCLSALMLGLEISSIPTILPTLENILPADFKQLQWIMNAYTIAMTTCLMAMGALADRFGRKRIFMVGIVIFGIASLVCGLATSAPMLIGARFFQGISAAAMLACQVAILSHQFRDGRERGIAFGWWGIIFGIGLGFGPIVGGLIVALSNWQWVFLVHVVLAVITLLLVRIGVEESVDPNAGRVDLMGMGTLSISVFGLVYLITQGDSLSFENSTGIVIATVSALSFLLFIFIENRVVRPMFDFAAFRVRNFSGALLGSCGMNFSFWPFVIYLPIYFQAVLGYDSVTTGLILLAYTLPTLIIPPIAERLLLRFGPGSVIPLGLFTIGTGFFLMHFAATSDHASWMTMLPGSVLAGIGLGLTNTPVTNTATASLPVERAGMASGMDMSARMISLAINIALMGFILLWGIQQGLEQVIPGVQTQTLVESLAAGNLDAGEAIGISISVSRQALSQGFSWVMFYGAACSWGLSVFSLVVFGRRSVSVTG
ncbi:MFS transporter [Kiloniella antarctica]|uniref:MFS transporter n=1 Tax=Kiloniella antarctica TaxID=1550907 RepID=A0ABW5BHQ9_9PROT